VASCGAATSICSPVLFTLYTAAKSRAVHSEFVFTDVNMSHKRPATSVLASTRRSKKPKVFKKQQLSQLIADVIESVGSQSSLGSQSSHSADSDKGLEEDIEGGATCMEAGAEAGSDATKSLDDSLTQEAISVCKNMHAEYAKLTNVIKHQHTKISREAAWHYHHAAAER